MKKRLFLNENELIKWSKNGKNYFLQVVEDNCSESPREWENQAIFACFHRHYNLGDNIDESTLEDFLGNSTRKYAYSDIAEKAINGSIKDVKVISKENGLFDIYEENINGVFELAYENVCENEITDSILDNLYISINTYIKLLKPYVYISPLYLYDHSGLSISTGAFSDKWDSGLLGVAVIAKDKIIKEYGEAVEWEEKAQKIIEAETEIYDYYLRGEVYGYVIYEENADGQLDIIDGCYGFYGADLYENGISDTVDYNFSEAIESGNYIIGKIKANTTTYYTFEN